MYPVLLVGLLMVRISNTKTKTKITGGVHRYKEWAYLVAGASPVVRVHRTVAASGFKCQRIETASTRTIELEVVVEFRHCKTSMYQTNVVRL